MFFKGPSRAQHNIEPPSLRSTVASITYLRNQQIYSSLSTGMETEEHRVKRSYRTLATGVEKLYMAIGESPRSPQVIDAAWPVQGQVKFHRADLTHGQLRSKPLWFSPSRLRDSDSFR